MNHIAQLGRLAAQQQKQAFDVSRIGQQAGQFAGQMANKGLQSPIGQGVLGAGANLYNKMPQGGRDWISNQAIKNFSRPDDAQGFPQRHGFNRDPSLGTGINATTTVEMGTKPDGNAYDNLDDRLSSMTPGHAGSPLGQVLGGIMSSNSRMPASTFPQGTPVANQFDVHNDNITADKLVPRSMFDQQYTNQMMPEPSPAQDYPNNPGGGGPHMDYNREKAPDWDAVPDYVRDYLGIKPQPAGIAQQLPAPGGPPQGVMQQLPAGPGHQGLIDRFPGASEAGRALGAINRKPQPSGTAQQLPAGPGHQGLMQQLRDAGLLGPGF